jgi:hypothetical protein
MTSRAVNAKVRLVGPFGWSLLLAFLILAAVAMILRNLNCAIAAVLPAVLLGGIVLGRPRNCRILVGEQGLSTGDRGQAIPYDRICALTVNLAPYLPEDAPPRGVVRVITPSAIIVLAGKIDVSRRQLLRGLLDRIPRGGQLPYQSSLQEFARSQREQFGSERVWTFRAVERCRRRSELKCVGWAVALIATIWLLAAIAHPGWWVCAAFALLVAFLIWAVIQRADRWKRFVGRRWQQSGLVIAPAGLAMIQGGLQGKARWNEISSARFVSGALMVDLAGAKVVIADIYDRPIQQIVELIWFYMGVGHTALSKPSIQSPATAAAPSAAEEGKRALVARPNKFGDLPPGIQITNDQELHVAQERIRQFQSQVNHLRQTEPDPENFRAAVDGLFAEIDRMQLEVKEYLSHHPSEAVAGAQESGTPLNHHATGGSQESGPPLNQHVTGVSQRMMNEGRKDNEARKEAVPPDLRQLARDSLKRERRRRFLFLVCGCLAAVAILTVLVTRFTRTPVQRHDAIASVSRADESPAPRFPMSTKDRIHVNPKLIGAIADGGAPFLLGICLLGWHAFGGKAVTTKASVGQSPPWIARMWWFGPFLMVFGIFIFLNDLFQL